MNGRSEADLRRRVQDVGGGEHLWRRLARLPAISGQPFSRPGRTHGLSVRDGRGALWTVGVDDGGDPFRGDAARSAALAWELIAGELGGLRPDRVATMPSVGARLTLPVGADAGVGPDGDSFGLSQALALASWLLDQPLPGDLAATAALGVDGSVAPVSGLDGKLAVVEAWGIGIRRLLVAAGQVMPRRIPGLEIIEVRSLEQALDHALLGTVAEDARHAALARRCLEGVGPEQRPRLAASLFRLAVEGSPRVLEWGTVAALARLLGDALDGDDAWRCSVAAEIATRHAGVPERSSLGEWERLEALPLYWRLAVAAHAVQHLADGADPDWAPVAERAARLALQHPGLPGTARLHGALGRLHAAWGRVDAAVAQLQRAWSQWRALLMVEEAAWPLCEWLRVLGATADAAGVAELLDGPVSEVLACRRTSRVSRAFLSVAVGRALLAVGRADDARRWLHGDAPVPDHLAAAWLRLRCMLDPDDGAWARLAEAPGGTEHVALLRLHHGDRTALQDLSRIEVDRIRSFVGPGEDLAAAVVRWWRY